MNRLIYWIVLLVSVDAYGQYTQWSNLKPGPYSIGYKVVILTDSSRYYQDISAPFADQKSAKQYRRIPLFIWYPARSSSGDKQMLYKDYFPDLKYENPYVENGMENLLTQLKKGWQISDNHFEQASLTKIPVVKQAAPIHQKFPVVLHTHATGLLMQSVLMEFLASNGYIVISYPHLGVDPLHFNWNDGSIQEEVVSADDVGFIISKLSYIVPYAAIDNISFIGMLAEKGVNHQFASADLKAIACLGCFLDERVKQLPYYDPRKFRIPLLQIPESWRNNNPLFIDSLVNAPRWTVKFKEIVHTDFYPVYKVYNPADAKKYVNYEYIALIALEFLDAVQKKNIYPATFSSVPAEVLYAVVAKTDVKILPTETEFLSWIRNGDIAKAESYAGQLTQSALINDQLMRQLLSILASENKPYLIEAIHFYFRLYPKDPKQTFMYIFRNASNEKMATAIFDLLIKKFPVSPYPYDGLSDYYENTGNAGKATVLAKKALELLENTHNISQHDIDELKQKLQEKMK
ncbi:hypothetical protein GXP67_08805 [Rhodocytophaga rosea]|uniref:Alpha/beta hydrolase n=1 Tax=Rhodocytophaga rosea TaxID=2704465 RepID=A0A6C0GG81_9BACT|nr:hypothetical protein [Rhodocytophaga rosea]QHT66752.1 hypothetical protein GXP67_08805 [Rhodocytophaga rosea]